MIGNPASQQTPQRPSPEYKPSQEELDQIQKLLLEGDLKFKIQRVPGKLTPEQELMEFVAEMVGADGMRDSGGLWRVRIRGDANFPPKPGKVRRIMEQLQADKREGFRPDTSWNRYALYLWKEFADWPCDRRF